MAEGGTGVPCGSRVSHCSHAAHSNEDNGDGDDGSSSGGRRIKPPKEVHLTDPQATWIARPGVGPFFAYDASYLINNKTGIIIDAEGTRANRIVEISVSPGP